MADIGPSSATFPVDVQQICTGRNENSAVQDPEVTECEDKSKSIQAIDKGSVHRICSGQVVLTLATAVKELVENSIDAGATSVEVRLKDYGSESIEVIDNGSGVEEKNFEGLTLKHHTSKLQDFDDLINVTTFGFRGEALSSLCALSNMAITTRNKSAAVGTRLEFDLDGKITVKKSVPRQVGTTVQVQNIFHSLPVRHKEFHRNLKKEFAKLAQVLNAYCIVNTGVRITCSNQTAKGSRSTVVSTNGNEHMKENIANVFGPKQLQSLLAFEQVEAQDDVCSDFGIKPEQKSAINFKIEGFVSKCEHGQGRGSSDRQFIFINRRPCDASKIMKLINEVYHSYNRHQNPFIALNISMNKESVDVNVTPDKRQIFLEGERLLLAVLKTSLIQMFEPTTSVYRVNNFLAPTYSDVKSTGNEKNSPRISHSSTLSQIQDGKEQNDRNGSSISNTLSRLKRSFSSAYARNDSSPVSAADSPNKKFKSSSPFPMSGARSSSLPSHPNMSDQGSIAQFFSRFSPKKSSTSSSVQSSPVQIVLHDSNDSNQSHCDISVSKTRNDQLHDFSHETSNKFEDKIKETNDKRNNNITLMSETNDSLIEENSVFSDTESTQRAFNDKSNSQIRTNSEIHIESQSEVTVSAVENVNNKGDTESVIVVKSLNFDVLNTSEIGKEDEVDGDREYGERDSQQELENSETAVLTELDFHDIEDREAPKKEKTVSFSLAGLKKKLESCKTKNHESQSSSCGRSFRAKISPGDNQSAEDELKREISKDMFSKMEILGQFNLGFIITKLGRDLFIVDQHATDEKYNFEMLQRDTVLQSQKMIIPQGLELTASNETILVDNLGVFKKNGFDFAVNPEAPPTQRVKLVSAPVSKNWSFGKDDIEELLFMLTDSPNVMCRPTRVRMMFASRACRKSIMIGTALNKSEMRRLVTHMGEIEQPWNCPHGRPTMRHLFNLDMLPTS